MDKEVFRLPFSTVLDTEILFNSRNTKLVECEQFNFMSILMLFGRKLFSRKITLLFDLIKSDKMSTGLKNKVEDQSLNLPCSICD